MPPKVIFYKTEWAWQSVKITVLMSIFASKSFEIFDENSADEFWSKKTGWKVPSLMPIRVKGGLYSKSFHLGPFLQKIWKTLISN